MIRVPLLTAAQLDSIAQGYLKDKHPTGTLPVPIEEIVDVKERIDIVPVENLDVDGHEAFTARDRKTIYVEARVFGHSNPNRLRSTLAHELSHIILHGYVFEAADYDDLEGFRKFMADVGDLNMKRLEDQAYKLAGYLLVPSSNLTEVYSEFVEKLNASQIDIESLPPDALRHVAKLIGDRFGVSAAFIHSRAVREGLWRWDDFPPQ